MKRGCNMPKVIKEPSIADYDYQQNTINHLMK